MLTPKAALGDWVRERMASSGEKKGIERIPATGSSIGESGREASAAVN
jgi:hypothetical protein